MRLKEYLALIFKALNPNRHRDVSKKPFFDIVKYFFFVFGLSLLVSIVLLLPTLIDYKSSLGQELEEFEKFEISVDSVLEGSITVLEKPRIVIDYDKENMTGEWVLVNNKSIMYNKFIFFGESREVFADYKSINNPESVSLYSKIVIFLLPAVVFWIAVLFLIKYAILIGLFSVLGWVFFLSGKHHLSFQKALKIAIFTATPMVLIDLILWPITILYLVPIGIYLIYFLMGLVMVADRKYSKKEEKVEF